MLPCFDAKQGVNNSYQAVAFKLFSVILGDWQYDYLVDMLAIEGNWCAAKGQRRSLSACTRALQIKTVVKTAGNWRPLSHTIRHPGPPSPPLLPAPHGRHPTALSPAPPGP
jgi:hypothetical protein